MPFAGAQAATVAHVVTAAMAESPLCKARVWYRLMASPPLDGRLVERPDS
jgi:hypothetical protein